MQRRRFLVAATGVTVALSGCSSDSSGGSEDDSAEGGTERPDDWPDNQAFTPNPDAGGPGGDVDLAMQFSIRDYRDASDYEQFEVDFDQIVLHDETGDSVEVPVDRQIDFMNFELETDITLVFAAPIPTGSYTHVDYEMEATEIVHDEEGDVTENFTSPPRAEFSSGPLEMAAGDQWLLMSTLHVGSPVSPTLEESIAVGSYSGPGDMTDPSYFEG